jgi:hypothetical protein
MVFLAKPKCLFPKGGCKKQAEVIEPVEARVIIRRNTEGE